MQTPYESADELKQIFITGNCGTKNVLVGMEKGIGAKECPFFRVDPYQEQKNEDGTYTHYITVYVGIDKKNTQVEERLKLLYDFADCIKTNLPPNCVVVSTVIDNDSLPNLRLLAMDVEYRHVC